jgi:hypothetical protein
MGLRILAGSSTSSDNDRDQDSAGRAQALRPSALWTGWITPGPNELVVDVALAGIHDVLLPSTVLGSPTPHRRLGAMSGVTGAAGGRDHPPAPAGLRNKRFGVVAHRMRAGRARDGRITVDTVMGELGDALLRSCHIRYSAVLPDARHDRPCRTHAVIRAFRDTGRGGVRVAAGFRPMLRCDQPISCAAATWVTSRNIVDGNVDDDLLRLVSTFCHP